jgi:hypothetical protein
MEEFDGDVYEKLETAKSNSDANINQSINVGKPQLKKMFQR